MKPLPDELLLRIFALCTPRTVLKNLKRVCRRWRAVAAEYGLLDLTWANWSAGGWHDTCAATDATLTKLIAYHTKVTTVRLDGATAVTANALARTLAATPALVTAALVRCDVHNSTLYALAEHCRGLATVDFSKCLWNINDGINVLARSCPLASVSLADCAWANDDTLRALANCGTLRQLQLSKTRITEVGLTHLGEALPITDLDVVGCRTVHSSEYVAKFTSLVCLRATAGIDELLDGRCLVEAVLWHCPAIASLHVKNQKPIQATFLKVLLTGRSGLTTLAINASAPCTRDVWPPGVPTFALTHFASPNISNATLFAVATWCPRLQVVDVSGSPGLTDATVLARPSTTSLDLRNTAVDDATMFALATHASCLASLSAHDCEHISPLGIAAVLNAAPIKDISYRAMRDASLMAASMSAERRGVAVYKCHN